MFVRTLRHFRELQKTAYSKVPIIYPEKTPEPPSEKDFEVLQVQSSATNREIVASFRQLSFHVHPANETSAKANERFLELVKAYDKIVLFRMAEGGVPQPYSEAYYPPQTHTRLIKDFLNENDFWTPHVSDNYVSLLLVFWTLFGLGHTAIQFYNPFISD